MKAQTFHRTVIGQKVFACIGRKPHIAKITEKNSPRLKFMLCFHLTNGEARHEERSASRCELAPIDSAMGLVRRKA
jgi:hypothetical protein